MAIVLSAASSVTLAIDYVFLQACQVILVRFSQSSPLFKKYRKGYCCTDCGQFAGEDLLYGP